MVHSQTKWLWTRRLFILPLLAFYTMVLFDLYERYKYMFTAPIAIWNPSFYLITPFCLGVFAISIVGLWKPGWLLPLCHIRQRLKWFRWVIVIAAGMTTSWFFLFSVWSEIFSGSFARVFLYIVTVVFMAWMASGDENNHFEAAGVIASAFLFSGTFFLFLSFQYVRDYPFPFYWSEGNRMWDYSLMYGRRLYLYPLDEPIPTLIDSGRQSLWGLPFLFPWVNITIVRLWSGIVFSIPYAFLGWFTFKTSKGRLAGWLLAGIWTMVFLGQAPIYTPLILAAILVAAATRDRTPLWIGLALVLLAGYYTYISRDTWIFAPAIWSAMIAMVNANRPDNLRSLKNKLRYFSKPAAFAFAGLLGGYIIPTLIPQIIARINKLQTHSGGMMTAEGFQTIMGRQPLLWERLWPSTTYPLGIVLGLILAILPVGIILLYFARDRKWLQKLDFWQLAAMGGALLAFLVVGIIISVKIGGGSNLHNLDMFLICIVFIAGLAWKATASEWLQSTNQRSPWIHLVIVIAAIQPISAFMMSAAPIRLPPQVIIDDALGNLRSAANDAKETGDILFLDHRQLLTFGYVEDIPLVPEYEKKWMMDEAMAANADFFEPFYQDLINQRFSLIVTELMFMKYQGVNAEFGNENDAWVKWVSIPVLCYYDEIATFTDVGLQLLVPREEPRDDPRLNCPTLE
jgi:hypothetical protein